MATPSCTNCPSFLPAAQVKSKLGKDYGTGVPACARFGMPLARTNSMPTEVIESSKAFAASCSKFGEELSPREAARFHEARIMVSGDLEVLSRGTADPDKKQHLRSCEECVNFIPANVVHEEVGFDLPMCGAFGRLLFPDRHSKDASLCDRGEPTWLSSHERLTTTKTMTLRPEYGVPVTIGGVRQRVIVEPSEYPTDLEVSPEDRAAGIRAWRIVHSQEDPSFSVPLPIYDAEMFSEDERAEIPVTGGEGHPELYVDHGNLVYATAFMWSEGKTPFLIGDTGAGKTEGLRHIAWLMQLPFVRISISKSTEVDHLVGSRELVDGSTAWVDGRLTKWWPKACVMVLDEANMAVNDVWEFLRPLLDDSKQFALDAKDGSIVRKHLDNYLALTANPAWDMRYVGVQEISPADMGRLAPFWIEYPPEEVERTIIVERCNDAGYEIPIDTVDTLLKVSKEIRALGDSTPIIWGVRNNLSVAVMTKGFSLMSAYRMGGLDGVEPTVRETILNIVKGYAK